MLPWYVKINTDGTTKNPEAVTWDQLHISRRDLSKPYRTPSGHPNMYGKIQYAFSATVSLEGLRLISDALVARKQ